VPWATGAAAGLGDRPATTTETMRLSRRSALVLLGASSWLLRGALATAAPTATSGLPQGITPDGHYYLGRVEAPVTMVEYGDFL
jgi:hypothetical protein